MTMTTDRPYEVRFGSWNALRLDAQAIRTEVFVEEQNVPVELEMDEMDAVCLHAVAYDPSGTAVATGRLLPDGHIGRMAVRKSARGAGVGGVVLQGLMAQAKARGHDHVALSSQAHAAPFYVRHGFVKEGEEFFEAGIAHVAMQFRFA